MDECSYLVVIVDFPSFAELSNAMWIFEVTLVWEVCVIVAIRNSEANKCLWYSYAFISTQITLHLIEQDNNNNT